MTVETARRRGAARTLASAALAILAACSGDADGGATPSGGVDPLVAFDTTDLSIITGGDTVRITAEVADDLDGRQYGLMERPSLPPDHGMVFVYPATQDSTGAFYMYRTLIPLDIAFLDTEGRILSIRAMAPCESPNPRLCRRYGPGVPFRAALEVNRGFFDRHGIEVGDRVEPLSPLIARSQ
jgi:uncharacterized membrane protein (UPF0127 family)